jgi:hypothetical protein
LLEYRRLALCALPSPQGLSAAFPLLPYEGVTAGQGFAASSDAVAALEYGRIAPTRSALIEGSGATPPVGPNPLTVAVTPQGYVAQFDGKGGLLRLSLGSNKGCKLVFSGPSGCTLPPDLRDVFLAPQQFVVISCNTAANGYASKYLQAAVEMDDWKFNMAITDAVNIAPGDYQTVIVVKAADASIADLAGSPSAWTGYGLFNDTTSDPNGLVLSSWLSGYISQALAQYADGTGLASLENFCQLVTDPDWDGFLFLRVPVMVPEQFDASLDFLLAGVDRSQLMAHHLGSESNRTTPAGGATPSYSQDSAFFGLVHYVRPGTQPGAIASTPSFVPSTADYDFQLLTLSAIFSNDALQNFSSAALVVMNNLFGDDVLSTMPSQQTTQGSPSPTNAILIDGTLQHHDGVPAYRFATAPGSASTFYLSGNALNQVQIDRAVVTLDPSSANGATSTVTFQMSGWLGTLNDADFDLLSYAGVSFSNLALNMSYNTRSGANKSFIFDPSGLALAALPEIPCGDVVTPSAVAANTLYRPGSLAATFPLKLDRFVVGTADKLPADIGYRSLDTQPASSGGGVSGNWYGVQASLPLGSPGALDSANLLSATLLLAWNADGGGAVAITPFIKITGPGGVDLSFQLEGILKFGAQGLLLTKTTDQIFVLEFRSIGISLFSLSFPPAGSTNLLVAGLPDRSLGWFGAYIDPKAPLI